MAPSPLFKAGVMGWPVGHTLSPRLHGFWLRHYGIDGVYDALPVRAEDLAASLRGLPAQGMRGVNLTVPHKEAACALVDELDPSARRVGAVNLVLAEKDGKLRGHNTDVFGFAENLRASGFAPKGGAAFVLGAGGAARAVIAALSESGFGDIRIANRTGERAEKLAKEFSTPPCRIVDVDWADALRNLAGVDLLVNATVLGMAGQPDLDFPIDALPRGAAVADIVYAPLETPLLKQAKARGHKAIDGLGMLLHQARPSFSAFFGRDPEVTDEVRNFVSAGEKQK